MKLSTSDGREFIFEKVELIQIETNITNVFKKYRKSLRYAIDKNYKNLKPYFQDESETNLDMALGDYLFTLKENKNDKYEMFLNKYGDKTYSKFRIQEKNRYTSKGLYVYCLNNETKYIGSATKTFKDRVNDGYGNISAKNCYKDGQSTNCHINWLVSPVFDEIEFKVCPLDELNNDEIEKLEKNLIRNYNPPWNSQL